MNDNENGNRGDDLTASELPLGLGMAFAQDTDALRRFTGLDCDEQDALIERARQVRTRAEMQRLVASIGTPAGMAKNVPTGMGAPAATLGNFAPTDKSPDGRG